MARRLALALSTTVFATIAILLPAPASASQHDSDGPSVGGVAETLRRGTSWERIIDPTLDGLGTSWEWIAPSL